MILPNEVVAARLLGLVPRYRVLSFTVLGRTHKVRYKMTFNPAVEVMSVERVGSWRKRFVLKKDGKVIARLLLGKRQQPHDGDLNGQCITIAATPVWVNAAT